MDIKPNSPVLDSWGREMLDTMFYKATMSLEQLSSKKIVLSHQLKINNLKKRILNFISDRRYSWFEISILSDEQDFEKPLGSIKVKNFDYYIDDIEPNGYLITIHPTWGNCDIFQLSVSGMKIKEIII